MMTWTVPSVAETIILWSVSILFGYLIFSVSAKFPNTEVEASGLHRLFRITVV